MDPVSRYVMLTDLALAKLSILGELDYHELPFLSEVTGCHSYHPKAQPYPAGVEQIKWIIRKFFELPCQTEGRRIRLMFFPSSTIMVDEARAHGTRIRAYILEISMKIH